MQFAAALTSTSRLTHTENGATAYSSTGNALLDLFGCIGSLREADPQRVMRLFADAYAYDPLLTTKCLFYARDVRGGLGERHTFRLLLRYAATKHPEAIVRNIPLIGLYGRFDDLYELIGTPLEKNMWTFMRAQFAADRKAMQENKPCSLLAKWIKTPDASSKATRNLGILTAKAFGLSVYEFKRRLRALRKYINVVETKMSAKEWQTIDYSAVPSKAMTLYRKAFSRHDADRYSQFLTSVEKGEEKINSSALFPYDIIERYVGHGGLTGLSTDRVLEAQWKAMPDFVGGDANAIVIADTSGSMWGRPLYSAVGLAIYFADRNRGPYHGLWMSFSQDSRVQKLRGETLAQKLASIDTNHWGMSTNLEAAFMSILNIAIKHNVSPDEMVKSIIVISDMEIDHTVGKWSFYDEMKTRYEARGYQIPNVVYWNVNSRHDIFHADSARKGVQLCSGQATSTFKHLMASINKTPIEMMLDVLNSERYEPITM